MNKRIKYAILFFALLICEILIGTFVHDNFVRPFIGDVLVVILIWSAVRIVFPEKPKFLSPFVFIFAVGCELLQLADIISLLNITNPVIKIALGSHFDIYDIFCYAAGCAVTFAAELIIKPKESMIPMTINVAIDGPAGAGKSTIAKECAKRLGYIYTDTGALYRAIGLYVYRTGKDCSDEKCVVPCLDHIDLKLSYTQNGTQAVILNGEDVSSEIRKPEISMAASQVSAIPAVRAFLLELQRSIAEKNNVIMDGRDIGTVILPNAQIKIFLTASPEMRAKRRCDELLAKGQNVIYDDVLNDIIKRDEQDSTRAVAPLKPAADSIIVDTTELDIEQSVEKIIGIIESRCAN